MLKLTGYGSGGWGVGMSGRLDGIQILRFVAAAMVLIQHAVFLPSLHYQIDVMPFRKLGIGTAGVYIFFVISGYVMAGLIDQRPLRFALHRIVRIYPPYIVAIALSASLVILLDGVAFEKVRWVWSYTLLPLGGPIDSWAYVPFWTLIYEITFYAVTFGLMFGGQRCFDIGLVVWALLIVITAYFLPTPRPLTANVLAILTNPVSLLFIAGAALGRLHAGNSWPIVATGLITWTAYWRAGTPYQSIPIFSIGVLAAIHLAVRGNEFIARQTWLKPVVRGGDYSYGLYLMHMPVISVVLLLGLAKIVNYWFAVAICIVIGGAAGILFGFADFQFYQRIARRSADRIASLGIASSASDTQIGVPAEVPMKAAPPA
ncbi:acyltransferase 3 [Bradyrhizobiaceae bacterium SG-6C]|nr:acyltransferase 3 [Bradyrhizobiaceae bacterium SG-6C]